MFLKNLLVVLIVLFLSFSSGYTQESDEGLIFEFQTGLVKFSFDGKFDNGDFGFGFQYQTPKAVVEPGLYLTTNLDLSNSNGSETLNVGVMTQVTLMRTMSLGIWHDWWKSNIGLRKWYRSNSGFMFSYNFEF